MSGPGASITILIPSFNDWEALAMLLARIERALAAAGRTAAVLVADDASTEALPAGWLADLRLEAVRAVEVLHLRSNQGHQRAIALGLYHIYACTTAAAVAIMDADGEDRAEDLPALLEAFEAGGSREVVFAARTQRREGAAFRFFYRAYKLLHRLLTGVEVRVGNFSVAPRSALERLMAVPDVWNHYAAAVFRARLPRRLVPLARGTRLAGSSKMNFVSLLAHGLGAMSVFSEQVSARLLAASAGFAAIAAALIALTVGVRLFTSAAIPGWATYTVGVLLGLVLQSLTFAVLFAFLIAHRRSSLNFLALRDAPYFLLSKTTVRAAAADAGASLEALARAQEPSAGPAEPVGLPR